MPPARWPIRCPIWFFAILAVAWLKATGAETLMARAFEGRETRMIVLAALVGGLAPFCSCEVIPFIAALLAVGVPLSAVMAFWLASPLMDPAMFL
ncbi:MAG: permease [Paracoccaceae bacterium]